jgi:site-specific DNA-methyltransferase (adenine-specific)
MLELNKIYNMDCIEWMKLIPDWSIDCIITDPPYWTTACKRDTIIPFDLMREQLKRIIKPNWAIVLFGSEPFSSALRMSNIKNYKYDWIWEKSKATGYLNSKIMPMWAYENIIIFWKTKLIYNPQMREWEPYNKWTAYRPTDVYWKQIETTVKSEDWKRYPRNVVYFKTAESEWRTSHPTQKPVALIEYLIKTYTNEWETVLDFTIWSWTTAVACLNTNRNFIWFELDKWYRKIANKRLENRK